MKNHSRFIMPILCLFFCFAPLFSQNSNDTTNKAVEFLKHEKLRLTPEQAIKNYINNAGSQRDNNEASKPGEKTLNNTDMPVTNDPSPESEVHAAINPIDTNNIVISPIEVDLQSNPSFICPVYFTRDFGKTWVKSSMKADPSHENSSVMGGGDPVLVFDANGALYFSWIDLFVTLKYSSPDSIFANMYWASSSDGGENWRREGNDVIQGSSAKFSNYGGLYGLTEMPDKQWMCSARNQRPDGNPIFTTLTKISMVGYTESSKIILKKKLPNENQFSDKEVDVSKGQYSLTQFSMPGVDNNGIIHVIFYGAKNNQNSFYYARSTDGGNTFSDESKITDFVISGAAMLPGDNNEDITGISRNRLYPSPQIAIDKSFTSTSGNIYFVWSCHGITKNNQHGLDVYFMKSTDGGSSWSSPVIINDDIPASRKVNQFYPSVTVNDNGVVIVTWYDKREDKVNDLQTNLYMAYSFDGGNTFTKNFRVSTAPTNFATIGTRNSQFGIGEYTQVLSTKGYAIPVWTDGRNNNGNLNIYTAFIPISKDVDGIQAERIEAITDKYQLFEPVPSVASSDVKLGFRLNAASRVSASLVNESGLVVREIAPAEFNTGDHSYNINVAGLAPGVYFFRLETAFGWSARKIVVPR